MYNYEELISIKRTRIITLLLSGSAQGISAMLHLSAGNLLLRKTLRVRPKAKNIVVRY